MENRDCLVSIIVPVYQVEDYVARCIESLLCQTYKNIEVLLIDDGSKDKSGTICEEYAKKDSRIRVYHKANGGLSDARNYGIDLAKGEYFAFVDSDDFVHSKYIEILLENCIKNECPLAVCDFERLSGNKIEVYAENADAVVKDSMDCLKELTSNGGNHVLMTVAWNKLYKRELFQNIRYPVGMLHEDEATTYKLLYEAKRIALDKNKLYGYYQSPDSIMRSRYKVKRLDIIDIIKERIDFFKQQDLPELEMLTKMQLSDNIIYHYYNVKTYIQDSREILGELKETFGKYCVFDRQCKQFGFLRKLNNRMFWYLTDIYLLLFHCYQKIKG